MASYRPGREIPEKGKGRFLSGLQKRWLDEYFVDMNATAAVIRAGYKCKPENAHKQGADNLQNPLLRKYIDERMAEKREKTELSAEYVIQKLISIVEDTDKSNPQAALRGLELLGKTIALFKERQEISGPDGDAIKMEQKVQENVQDFTRKLSSLASRSGEGTVVEFPKRSGEGEA